MIADLDTFLTALCVELTDRIIPVRGFTRCGPGARPEVTDAGLMCIAVAQRGGGPGGGLTGRQPGDDLPGYHQPVQLVPGISELLAQQPGLAGQLSHPAGDPFR